MLATVQQKIPANYGILIPTETSVAFQGQGDNLANTARYLVGLNLPFVVHEPPELREALLDLAKQITHSATAHRWLHAAA